jgi:glucose/arabinose dehydrogenase
MPFPYHVINLEKAMKQLDLAIPILVFLTACANSSTPATATKPSDISTKTLTPAITPSPAVPAQPAEIATAAFPPPPVRLQPVAAGLDRPVYLTHAGDGSGRLFLVEKPGRIRIRKDGALLPDPFLDITGMVTSAGSEQGLLGLAFDPDYRSNGRFFVNYIDLDGNTAVARYRVSAADPDKADPTGGKILLGIHQPYANHNGGGLVFGPDGYLYIGTGDGGSEGDPLGNGQKLDTLLGKLLRVDVSGDGYAIPADNPFVNQADARPEIWAYGLRNPWRFAFDRATGDLYIADVGQDAFEEIDFQPAGSAGGRNYGWSILEGFHPYRGGDTGGLTPPVAEYPHTLGNCSVTGGYVYRGSSLPALSGVYLFGDYCTGNLWVLRRAGDGWRTADWFGTGIRISSFGEDEAGELYVLDYRGGEAYHLRPE